jgi:hypothetical protein
LKTNNVGSFRKAVSIILRTIHNLTAIVAEEKLEVQVKAYFR